MPSTYIVDIDPEHANELSNWVNDHDGSVRPWNLVHGDYGVLYTDADQPSLNQYLRFEVAVQNPDKHCPTVAEMNPAIAHHLLEIAVNSYEWMHEGHFDEVDLPRVMEAISEALVPREPVEIPDREILVAQLSHRCTNALPDWAGLNPAQRAVISEAVLTSTEWANERRLDSYTEYQVVRALQAAAQSQAT